MTENLQSRLENFSTIGKKVHFYEKSPGKKKYYRLGEVIDEVSVVCSDYKHFIQKIQCPNNNVAYRVCYYTLDANKRRLVFGQYASFIYEEKFQELMKKAIEKFGAKDVRKNR